jgi:hypothetical protein
MGIFLATVFAMALWVALWGVGVKAMDGFMLFLLIVLGAAIAHIITPHLPGNRQNDG